VSANLKLYAHSANESGRWHDLHEHLVSVAELARRFAARLSAAGPAFWSRLWHGCPKAPRQSRASAIK
jgi:hypothetical protein